MILTTAPLEAQRTKPVYTRRSRLPLPARATCVTLAAYSGIVALIVLPVLRPGYLLVVDMVAVPQTRLVPSSNGWYLYVLLTYWLGHLIPADVLEKAALAAALLAGGLGMHRLARLHTSRACVAYTAGLLFLFNPAVYGRLLYGQWPVFLGWALLPWLLVAVRQALRAPQPIYGLAAGLIAGIMLSLAPHSVFYLGVVCGCGVLALLASAGHRALLYRLMSGWSERAVIGVAVLALLALTLPWLIPTLRHTSPVGSYLAAQTPALVARETQVFATVADPRWGALGNVLAGYGFWAEATRRFVSAKVFFPQWPALIFLLPLLSAIGLLWRWRRGDRVVAPALAASALLAVPLAIGVSSPLTRPLSDYLYAHLPFYTGLRDAQKWEGVLLLAYAYLVAGAADALLSWATAHIRAVAGLLTVSCVLMPIVPGAALLGGGWGQLRPVSYPTSWALADHVLMQEMPRGAAVFLPWHLYLSFPFTGRVVANPAPAYFTRPVVSSGDAGIGLPQAGSSGGRNGVQGTIAALLLVDRPRLPILASGLARAGLCGILLAHTVDWTRYRFVLHAPGLSVALRSPEISVVVNTRPPCT